MNIKTNTDEIYLDQKEKAPVETKEKPWVKGSPRNFGTLAQIKCQRNYYIWNSSSVWEERIKKTSFSALYYFSQ